MSNDKPRFRFFGLTLNFEVNVLALVAFLLSIGSLGLQAIQILRGPTVTLSPGERVNLVRYSHPGNADTPILLVNARLDYVNTGAVGRDAIVSSERLWIEFGDLGTYEYRWLHFELFVSDDAGEPKNITLDGAHSFLVPGAGAATHQTTFVPFANGPVLIRNGEKPKATHVFWDDFLERIEKKQPVVLRFYALDRRGGDSYQAACTLLITPSVVSALRKVHWTSVLCLPSKTA